ncbi:F-box-like domain-containing protein [Criblamydia sequanensis]|uniref:F-box and WD repeat-containing protein n=1 Tax=Candidatus Criblamydia sequanensis CRIB-18 TaxID=1437425 RepID=A0A090DXM3_9BACT|nr:F-box-like domain-containing protein [Criblamydia sequanensis]CDR33554.1 F-box and WD repeat-containing protein [Criblamydia sequanensis CRIB-18]
MNRTSNDPYQYDNFDYVDMDISSESDSEELEVILIEEELLQDPLMFLPEEIALEIFSYLSAREILDAGIVSKNWRRVSSDNSLFPIFFKKILPVTANHYSKKELKKNLYDKTVAFQTNLEDPKFLPNVKTFDRHEGFVTFLKVREGKLFSASENDLKIFNIKTQKEENKINHSVIRTIELIGENIYIGDRLQGRITKMSRCGEVERQVHFKSSAVFFLKKGPQGLYGRSSDGIQSFDLELNPTHTIFDEGNPISLAISQTSLFTGGSSGIASFDIERLEETHRFEYPTFGRNIESLDNQVYALIDGPNGVVGQLDFRSNQLNTLFYLPGYKSFGLIQILENKLLVDYLGQVWVSDLRTSHILNKIPLGGDGEQDRITALYANGESIFAGKKSGDIYQIEF